MLDPELVIMKLSSSDWEGVIRELAVLMETRGYVRPTFQDAVVTREASFPTGLPTQTIGVAIPHADIQHVLRPGMAVGRCATPVAFGTMGGARGETISVSLVVLLALTEPHAHVDMLQRLMDFFQDADATRRVLAAKSREEIVALMSSYLSSER